jgi:hypothetical protein
MIRIACMLLALATLAKSAPLKFAETLREVHAPADAKTVTTDFIFTNRSNKPVTISRYESACSCMKVEISNAKLRYAPGESGTIRAEFDMGNFSGEIDKTIALWVEGDPKDKPSITLTARVHIPVIIAVEPKTLKWPLNGKANAQTIRIAINNPKPIHITKISSSSQSFRHELKTIKKGKSYELVVTPLDLSLPALAIFRIETDCAHAKHKTQQAFAVVRKPSSSENDQTR